MWIVKLALRRPYTFVVMALLILLLGIASIKNTPTDIFPEIDIPVVTVVWQYSGLSADQMAKQITTFSEYTISSAVDNVKNIESQTLAGVAVIRIFFQPNVRIDSAIAQVTAVSQTILRRMPPGTQPPFIIRYNASSVPILQLALGSKNLSEAQIYDYGIYRVRQAIAPVRGATLPLPYGGKPRQIMIDLDPQALLSKGLSPLDVGNAVNAQNLTLPSGTSKIGERDRPVFHARDRGGALRAAVGKRKHVAAEVAVADLDVGELGALLVEHLDADAVQLHEVLHHLGEARDIEHLREREPPLQNRDAPRGRLGGLAHFATALTSGESTVHLALLLRYVASDWASSLVNLTMKSLFAFAQSLLTM